MGLRGLSTYILKKPNMMINYDVLPNSTVVIDGDAMARSLFLKIPNYNTCFGGDYDIYAEVIDNFLNMLELCKITPYVIFNHSPSEEEVPIKHDLMKMKIDRINNIKSTNEDIMPLFLEEVCKSIVQKKMLPMVLCSNNSQQEIVAIAKQLDCPVISQNSDFFIFNITYIPFYCDIERSEFNLVIYTKLTTNAETNKRDCNRFVRCKMFSQENFLSYTGLSTDMLPVLTLFLKDDNRVNFSEICGIFNNVAHRGLFIEKIIGFLNGKNSEIVLEEIRMQIKGHSIDEVITKRLSHYECKKSKFLNYLLFQSIDESLESTYFEKMPHECLQKFIQHYYYYNIMELFLLDKFYPKPLVEDASKPNSHLICFPIISAIHKILKHDTVTQIMFYGRVGNLFAEVHIPSCNKDLPHFKDIQGMKSNTRLQLFLEILNIEKDFIENFVIPFPESWHIFLISLKYLTLNSSVKSTFISSLFLFKIVASVIDEKLLRIRSFSQLEKYEINFIDNEQVLNANGFELLDKISRSDCLAAIRRLIPFFRVTRELEEDFTLFDKHLVHCMSEFQACLFNITMLNDVLNRPYKRCEIWNCYNGTFIYNIFNELENEKKDFVYNLLKDSPTIFDLYSFVVKLF